MEGKRSAGSLASIRRMAASRSGGQSGTRSPIAGGAVSTWAFITVRVDPVNGAVPVIIS
jgi:hypothetical protein